MVQVSKKRASSRVGTNSKLSARREAATTLARRRSLLPVGGTRAATTLPVGALTATLATDADVTAELARSAPAFGDVLLSIGSAVARSQAALDKSMVETAQRLSNTKITVVTDVIQKLDDDGLPVGDDSELITAEVSLINFITPTVHEWEHVALSMDLEVGEFDSEQGVRFNKFQSRTTSVAVRPSGFLGWFGFGSGASTKSTSSSFGRSSSEFDSDWAQGQVRLDAQLSPRRTTKFPVPAEVTIGPSIFFAQGTITETKSQGIVTARAMDLVITVRKASGASNPNVSLEVDADAFRLSFATGGGFSGSSTNAQGQVKVTLTRDIPNERFLRLSPQKVTARLGQVSNSVVVNL